MQKKAGLTGRWKTVVDLSGLKSCSSRVSSLMHTKVTRLRGATKYLQKESQFWVTVRNMALFSISYIHQDHNHQPAINNNQQTTNLDPIPHCRFSSHAVEINNTWILLWDSQYAEQIAIILLEAGLIKKRFCSKLRAFIPKCRERFVDVGSFLQAVTFCTWGSLPESKKPISNWDLVAKLSHISAAILET